MMGDDKHCIMADFDVGCWQSKRMEEASKEKTAFFIPKGKKAFSSKPMEATNAHAFFVLATVMARWKLKGTSSARKDQKKRFRTSQMTTANPKNSCQPQSDRHKDQQQDTAAGGDWQRSANVVDHWKSCGNSDASNDQFGIGTAPGLFQAQVAHSPARM
jgi:hypothetical protein